MTEEIPVGGVGEEAGLDLVGGIAREPRRDGQHLGALPSLLLGLGDQQGIDLGKGHTVDSLISHISL